VKYLCPIICAVMLALAWGVAPCAADEGVVGAVTAAGTESDSARQLRIYEEALMRGSTEQSRTDAAVELLRRGDDAAWQLLLEALRSSDNPQAAQAVCRGLIESKSWSNGLRSRRDFMEPLIEMIINKSTEDAGLAAEALLIFQYSEVGDRLSKLAADKELKRQVRLNAVHALKLWPDKEAVLALVNLLDDADAEIAAAAAGALPYWIPRGTDKQAILLELQRKSPDEIIKARLEGLQQEMGRLQAQRDMWKNMYLAALDREYEKSDEDAKGRILVEKMADELGPVRLWAVRKAASFTGSRPEKFRDNLLALISDKDRQIRLATAGALVYMSVLNPAEKLLAQFKVETYPDVRLAIFDALGEACFFAFSPGSPVTLDESIRTETLAIAAGYIASQDPVAAAKGAEIAGKLLELNGLPKKDAQKYLQALASRYISAAADSGPLPGRLLNVMARLCGRGAYQQDAAALYGRFFIQGLAVKDDDALRRAAASGLVNIDKVVAFRLFKENGLANDSSEVIRRLVIKLAGELGQSEELIWLFDRLDKNGEAEPAWQAIREILAREDAKEVLTWGRRLAAGPDKLGYAGEVLAMAEKKADGQGDAELLTAVRTSLLDWYSQRDDYTRVVLYCNKLLGTTTEPLERERLQLRLLEACLQTADIARIGQIMGSRLAQKDLGTEDAFVSKIGTFLALPEANAATKTALIEALAAIKPTGARPRWMSRLDAWRRMIKPRRTPAVSSTTDTPPPD